MASQQPSQAARRRSQREDEQATSPAQRSADLSPKAGDDSEYFLLNQSQANSPPLLQRETPSAQQAAPPPAPPPREVRECWICREEDIDDTPENSVWRSPCPCSLQAHESCLLEWITDKEAPRHGEIALSTGEKIVCPVCKYPYQIDRPKDYVVMAVQQITRAAKFMILPTAASTIAGTLYSGLMVYGVNSIQLVFGFEEAAYLMRPNRFDRLIFARMQFGTLRRVLQRIIKYMDPFFPGTDANTNWKFFLGLPMIAPALVLSRTKMADPLFALIPVTYFMFRSGTPVFRPGDWPPGPALTFAVLPAFRSAYNQLYNHTFGELEKQWDKAVQRAPREGETAEEMAANQAEEDEENAIFDLQLEFIDEVHEHGHDGDEIPDLIPQNQAENNPDPQRNQGGIVPGLPDQGQRPPPRNQGNWEIRQNISTAQVINTVMGALFLPTISSLMGDLLKLTLPARLVSKSAARSSFRLSGAGRILSEKWGRSVVGGCLFVVLKDVVVLYCKWKKAKDFGKRKIVDYAKKDGK